MFMARHIHTSFGMAMTTFSHEMAHWFHIALDEAALQPLPFIRALSGTIQSQTWSTVYYFNQSSDLYTHPKDLAVLISQIKKKHRNIHFKAELTEFIPLLTMIPLGSKAWDTQSKTCTFTCTITDHWFQVKKERFYGAKDTVDQLLSHTIIVHVNLAALSFEYWKKECTMCLYYVWLILQLFTCWCTRTLQ